MLKIMTIFGTRPEAIKMAPVIKSLKTEATIETQICVTAQHRQMLDQVLDLFDIMTSYDLDIMKNDQDLTDITSSVLHELREVFRQAKPDRVVVHGDTATTMAASLAAYYQRIPVAHVEAGLRTDNIYSPWPEEINRRVASVIADLHFAPTDQAKANLVAESISPDKIEVTGNTVIDALFEVAAKIQNDQRLRDRLASQFPFLSKDKRFILVTGHRRENFGAGFEQICKALQRLSEIEDVQIVYPVHLNPNVREPVSRILQHSKDVHLIEPLDYLPFVYLMSRAYLVLTDSGGVQEEAPSLGKPVLVMRDNTERPEAVEAGTVKLVGANSINIIAACRELLEDNHLYQAMSQSHNPYGDGKAARKIVNRLIIENNKKTKAN